MKLVSKFKEYVRWYKHWGTLPVSDWVRGASYFREGNFKDACVHYRKALESHKEHPAYNSARFDLAFCLYRCDEHLEALSVLEGLIDEDVQIKEAYLLFARIKTSLGFVLTAKQAVERCYEIYPDDPQILSCLAHACVETNGPSSQIISIKEDIRRAKQEIDLEDSLVLHLDTALAHLEIRFGDLKKGERLLARVLATGSAPYEAILLRSERLLEQGRVDVSREQLKRAMKASPRDPRPVVLAAQTYLRQGSKPNPLFAKQLAESACKVSKWQNPNCLRILARAYEASGEESYASLLFEKVKELPSSKEYDLSFFRDSIQDETELKVSNS